MKEDRTFQQLCEMFAYTSKGRPLSNVEVAKLLGVHPGTIDVWRLRGDGPRFINPKGTRRVWYAEPDVLAWMATGLKHSTSDVAA